MDNNDDDNKIIDEEAEVIQKELDQLDKFLPQMNKKGSFGPKRTLHKYAFDKVEKPSENKSQLVELEKSHNYKPKFLVQEDKL